MNPSAYGDLTDANLAVWVFGYLLTGEKMYGIFSMLFGAGILLMTSRVEARGQSSAGLHYRRMAWLMLFGLLHGFLRKCSVRTLLMTAVLFFARSDPRSLPQSASRQ